LTFRNTILGESGKQSIFERRCGRFPDNAGSQPPHNGVCRKWELSLPRSPVTGDVTTEAPRPRPDLLERRILGTCQSACVGDSNKSQRFNDLVAGLRRPVENLRSGAGMCGPPGFVPIRFPVAQSPVLLTWRVRENVAARSRRRGCGRLSLLARSCNCEKCGLRSIQLNIKL